MRGCVWLLMAAAACADSTPPSTAVCDAHVWHREVAVSYANPVDLLFVIDSAPSMAQERRHFLEVQLPPAVDLLLGGRGADGDDLGLPPDLHFGVISADLGVGPDASTEGCSLAGDDGQLANASKCGASDPNFTWYFAGRDDRASTSAAMRCMADVSASGCQLSQPLEAALKALWPAPSPDFSTTAAPAPADTFLFRSGSSGHGLDTNAGFVRSRPAVSMLSIIILTDQDDCSTHDPTLSTLEACVRNPQALRAIQAYTKGFGSLRPDFENLVQVAIVAGVPPASISPLIEFEREVLPSDYDALLALPSMQHELDGITLRPSCTSAIASATPPRRLVQFARDFGRSAFVRSICDYDLTALLQDMLTTGYHGGDGRTLCLNARLTADSRGSLPCRMTWELPETADPSQPLTPTRCEERPGLLSVPDAGFPQRSERGRVLCAVRQAPTTRAADGTITPEGEGFYLDHAARRTFCPRYPTSPLRLTTRVPTGITVHVECVDETQHARAAGSRAIGESCQLPDSTHEGSDDLCGNPMHDRGPGKLFCHPERNRCVLACADDAQCPADWSCGTSGGLSTRVCVRPRCEP